MASPVLIFIQRGTAKLGPFTEEETVERFHKGEFSENDLAMVEGVTGWHPLGSYIVGDEGTKGKDFATSPESVALVAKPEEKVTTEEEALVPQCLEVMREENTFSVGLFQRRLRLGNALAVRMVEILDARGYLKPYVARPDEEVTTAQLKAPPPLPPSPRGEEASTATSNHVAPLSSGLWPVGPSRFWGLTARALRALPWALLGLGLLVMILSRWPWTLWAPFVAAALALAFLDLSRGKYAKSISLLLLAVALPWLISSYWLPDRSSRRAPSSSIAEAPPLPSAPVSEATRNAAALAPADSSAAKSVQDAALAEPTPPPASAVQPQAAGAVAPTVAKGQRVALIQNAPLYFLNNEFRLGQQGEEFEVLASQANKVFLSSKDAAGRTIALTTALNNVRLAPKSQTDARGVKITAPQEPSQAVYLVETDRGRGSGFVAEMGGATYIFTNYHVLKGAKEVTLILGTENLRLERTTQLDIAADTDLVRIPVARPVALRFGAAPQIGEDVGVFGNAGGAQVVTREAGTVLGVGPSEIEVSAAFIPGNSGGPIVDKQGEVIAVANLLRRQVDLDQWITASTRFGEARRFGVRVLEGQRWTRCTFGAFAADTQLTESLNSVLDEAGALTFALARVPFRERFVSRAEWDPAIANSALKSNFAAVLTAYNAAYIDRNRAQENPGSRADVAKREEKFNQRIRIQAQALGRCLQDGANDLKRPPHTFATEHTLREYQETLAKLLGLGRILNRSISSSGDPNFFKM